MCEREEGERKSERRERERGERRDDTCDRARSADTRHDKTPHATRKEDKTRPRPSACGHLRCRARCG
eukprot:886651-Rhodomonas_salina.2